MKRSTDSAQRPGNHPADSNDERHADHPVLLAEYMTSDALPPPATSESSAARPAGDSDFYRLALYNIGWDVTLKKEQHTVDGIATEICNMVHDKGTDAMGISEVFNLKDDRWQQRQVIMEHVVAKLNSGAGRPASSEDSSAAQPAWKGQCDGRYVFVWNSNRLVLTAYKYTSCGIKDQPWRMAQYLEFQHAESQSRTPLHVCHHCMYVNIASTAAEQFSGSAARHAKHGRQKISLSSSVDNYITISGHTALAYS